MFEAWIMICVAGTNNCFPAQDTRGPYEAHEQCYERTIEMTSDIVMNIPNHYVVGWKCDKPGVPT